MVLFRGFPTTVARDIPVYNMATAWAVCSGGATCRTKSSATAVRVPVSTAASARAMYSTAMFGASMLSVFTARNRAIRAISRRNRGSLAVAAMVTGVPMA